MSTQEVGQLIESVNDLTQTVANKNKEIDQKVDQAVEDLNNAFPTKYQEYSLRDHYVDCVNGNDSNDGLSWGNALKTINKALQLGVGAQAQNIRLSVGRHVISNNQPTMADIVVILGNNQSHYPSGAWSDDTSSVIHIDKRNSVRNGLETKLFGNLYVNNAIFTFEGEADNSSDLNTAFYGLGNVGLRLPLFVFDSVNRGVMTAGNNYNPFSSLGAELPQFAGEAAYYVKGNGSTCIVNMDRAVDRTSGMQQKFGSVVVLS